MKSFITKINIYGEKEIVSCSYYDINPINVWETIKSIINTNRKLLSYQLIKLKLLETYKDNLTTVLYPESFIIDVIFNKDCIDFISYFSNYSSINFMNKYVLNSKGNCTDKVTDIIDSKIEIIHELTKQIKERKDTRNTTEYKNTMSYEKDFNQISQIRDIADKISKICNKHLEHISDF